MVEPWTGWEADACKCFAAQGKAQKVTAVLRQTHTSFRDGKTSREKAREHSLGPRTQARHRSCVNIQMEAGGYWRQS